MHSLLRRTDKILTHFPCLTDDRANAVLSSEPFHMPCPGHVGKLVMLVVQFKLDSLCEISKAGARILTLMPETTRQYS